MAATAMRLLAAAAALTLPGQALYLPGLAPVEYSEGDKVELKVNKMTSVKTQLPYGYYSLPFCEPPKIVDTVENLGEILAGDFIENSAYDIAFLENKTCSVLCKKRLSKVEKDKFKNMVDESYLVNMIVDNLPAATRYVRQAPGGADYVFSAGFPVGTEKAGHYFINNHLVLDLHYHDSPSEYEGFRIVGVEVEPYSMNQHLQATGGGGYAAICSGEGSNLLDLDAHDEIAFTYSVSWTESPIRWSSRWDSYLKMTGAVQIHWFSLLNSLMIMLFLSGIVAIILLRTLHRDIAKYNEVAATEDDAADQTGWKLVHGDVFRKPRHAKLLVVSVGSGVQIFGMVLVTLVFAVLGFLSPAQRGGLLQSMMFLFTFMGVFAGYVSARLYKTMGGEDWKVVTLMTALVYPGLLFVTFFFLNLLIWGEKSSGAVPFLTMFAILVLWFGISVPLVFLGAYFAFKAQPIELPVRVNQIPRQVPTQPWFFSPVLNALLGGMLPFGAAFTELFFIMTSIWQQRFYYLFGFLFLTMVVLTITCAEISISITYFQLTAENYNWWWRSFFVSGSAGFYIFCYSVLYFFTRLSIDKAVSLILYFGYMWIFSVLFGVLTGSIGFLSAFMFVRTIYSSIKVD